MAQSLARNYIHLVFSTKERRPLINAVWRPDLWSYLSGAVTGQNSYAIKVGGVADHVHILLDLHRTVSLSKMVGEIKSESTKWVKREKGIDHFSWQGGFGAFSVSSSHVEEVTKYIAEQESHHQKRSFQDEFRVFLTKYQIEFDERYVWD